MQLKTTLHKILPTITHVQVYWMIWWLLTPKQNRNYLLTASTK